MKVIRAPHSFHPRWWLRPATGRPPAPAPPLANVVTSGFPANVRQQLDVAVQAVRAPKPQESRKVYAALVAEEADWQSAAATEKPDNRVLEGGDVP